MERPDQVQIIALQGLPRIEPGADLPGLIAEALEAGGHATRPGDIFVVAHKIVSRAESRIVRLSEIEPSPFALNLAERLHKEPRVVEVILRETRRIVRMDQGVLIAETRHGLVCANAGVDASNTEDGELTLLPEDPDASAVRLLSGLEDRLRCRLGVIIADTFGRPWREGLVNVAIGAAGVEPLLDYRGRVDFFGRRLESTVVALADEVAAAAELVMGKSLGIPVAIVRGFPPVDGPGTGQAHRLIRPAERDLFR